MRIWFDRHIESKSGSQRDLSWEEFVASVRRGHLASDNKDSVPVFSPALFTGKRHTKDTISGFGPLVVLDIDHLETADVETLEKAIIKSGLEIVIYTSYSHAPDATHDNGAPNPDCRYRVIIRLTEGYPLPRHHSVWHHANKLLGGLADLNTITPERVYYAPSCPPDRTHLAHTGHYPGRALDPKEAPDIAPKTIAADNKPTVLKRPNVQFLEQLASRWTKSKDLERAQMGALLGTILRGLPYAEDGQREATTWALCKHLGAALPDVDAAKLAALFAPSLEKLPGSDPPTVVEVADKIQRAQRTHFERLNEAFAAEQRETASRILEARGGHGTDPYSALEVEDLASRHHYTKEEMRHRWVVQFGPTFYLLGPSGYHAYHQTSASLAALTDLAPAASAGVELWERTQTGRRPLSANELVARYGTAVEGVDVSLTAQTTRVVGRRLTEAPCPVDPRIQPIKHDDVDEWLESLTDHPDTLRAWLAHVTLLDRPCAALVLIGPKHTGKSIIINGLSRLWGALEPTKLQTLASGWTDAITRCPLVFADERLPKDSRGRVDTGWLRELIQARTQTLNRKHRDTATLKGCIRLAISANSLEVLASEESMTAEDVEAVAERYCILQVRKESSALLEALPDHRREAWGSYAIAEHALYLRETICPTFVSQSRFIVKGPSAETAQRELATRAGNGAWVTQLLAQWILSPQRVQAAEYADESAVRVHVHPTDGIRVSADFVERLWSAYLLDVRRPSSRAIARTLGTLGPACRVPNPRGGPRVRGVQIDLETLRRWADETGNVTDSGAGTWDSKISQLEACYRRAVAVTIRHGSAPTAETKGELQ